MNKPAYFFSTSIRATLLAFASSSLVALAQGEIVGRVVSVADGDTLTILSEDLKQHKIRLAEIDAPEKSQPFGSNSRKSLADLCAGIQAHASVQTVDRYGRSVARVQCKAVDANAEQVRRGMAWVYDRYVVDRTLYRLQTEARDGRMGLWSDADPQPPWDFRQQKREK